MKPHSSLIYPLHPSAKSADSAGSMAPQATNAPIQCRHCQGEHDRGYRSLGAGPSPASVEAWSTESALTMGKLHGVQKSRAWRLREMWSSLWLLRLGDQRVSHQSLLMEWITYGYSLSAFPSQLVWPASPISRGTGARGDWLAHVAESLPASAFDALLFLCRHFRCMGALDARRMDRQEGPNKRRMRHLSQRRGRWVLCQPLIAKTFCLQGTMQSTWGSLQTALNTALNPLRRIEKKILGCAANWFAASAKHLFHLSMIYQIENGDFPLPCSCMRGEVGFTIFSSTAFTTVLGPTSQKWIWADPLVKSLNPCEWTKQTNILPINNWRSSPSLLGLETPSAEVRAAACWKGEAKWQPGWRCRKNRGIYQPFGVTILNG